MRIAIIALSILCLVLTGTTIYYARAHHALAAERERPVLTASQPRPDNGPVASVERPSAIPRTSQDKAGEPATVSESAPQTIRHLSEEELKASQMQFAKAFLAQAEDPQARQDLVAERRMQMRHTFPAVDRVLGLDGDEYSKLLDLLAEQQIEIQTQHSRCVIDSTCKSHDWRFDDATQQREIAALLGAERSQRFETYKNTLGERESVTQLRVRLPDAIRLPDSRAEELIVALAEERAALSREAMQTGTGTMGFGFGAGMIMAPSDGTPEAQFEAARQYSQRLRDRAAAHLDSEQQRVFNEMQEEQLVAFRNMLRNKNGQYSTVTYSMGIR